jgi:serine/threonine protein kinase
MEVEGISPLVHLGPLAGHEEEFHAMVEAEPPGRPSTDLAMPLAAADAVLIALEVADVLDRLHRSGQILGTLRPELIYLETRGDRLHLAGLAPRAEAFLAGATPCYGVGPLFDTVFASPEVIAGNRPVTAAADVFSLCTVLGLWLTGEHPFVGDDPISQMQAIMRRAGRVWRGPTALGMVLSAGLDRDAAHRPPLEQLATDLAAAARRDV